MRSPLTKGGEWNSDVREASRQKPKKSPHRSKKGGKASIPRGGGKEILALPDMGGERGGGTPTREVGGPNSLLGEKRQVLLINGRRNPTLLREGGSIFASV